MSENEFSEIQAVLEDLCEDNSVPKNIKTKFQTMIESFDRPGEASAKVNEALHNLDEIGDDTNLQSYVRTQIWNIVSMLEKVRP